MVKMLVVAEKRTVPVLKSGLEKQRYVVETACDQHEAYARLSGSKYDLVVLDLDVCRRAEEEVCKVVRASATGSAILVLSNGTNSGRSLVLNAGADHCIEKPYDVRELLARIRAMLRRPSKIIPEDVAGGSGPRVSQGPFVLDPLTNDVTKDGVKIHLHPMEFALFEFLLRNPDEIFTTRALWSRIWGERNTNMDTVRTHIKTLRQKIDCKGHPSFIKTVRGRGYGLNVGSRESLV